VLLNVSALRTVTCLFVIGLECRCIIALFVFGATKVLKRQGYGQRQPIQVFIDLETQPVAYRV